MSSISIGAEVSLPGFNSVSKRLQWLLIVTLTKHLYKYHHDSERPYRCKDVLLRLKTECKPATQGRPTKGKKRSDSSHMQKLTPIAVGDCRCSATRMTTSAERLISECENRICCLQKKKCTNVGLLEQRRWRGTHNTKSGST